MCVNFVFDHSLFYVFMIGVAFGGIGVMLAYWKRIFRK